MVDVNGVMKERMGVEMRTINNNDIVTICLSHNNCFTFQSGPKIYGAKVLHCPSDTGDSWYFELQDRTLFSLNPCSKDFIGVETEKIK